MNTLLFQFYFRFFELSYVLVNFKVARLCFLYYVLSVLGTQGGCQDLRSLKHCPFVVLAVYQVVVALGDSISGGINKRSPKHGYSEGISQVNNAT